jgi:hypothetical protein
LQPTLVLSVNWWPPPTGVGRVFAFATNKASNVYAKFMLF